MGKFLILLLLLSVELQTSLSENVHLYLWPHPQRLSIKPHPPLSIPPSFTISPPPNSPDLLLSAVSSYTTQILTERWSPVEEISDVTGASVPLAVLHLSASDLGTELQHGVDESYKLETDVSNSTASAWISANTTWGILRALETFSQLVRVRRSTAELVIPYGVEIHDWPLFSHRGFMLDTSRNFYPVKDLLRTIQAMADNKMNVFHWHISDSHSFPLVLGSEPELSRKGSYGDEFTYSREDVQRVVEFARFRGVRVIPELDFPGHTASWGGAYPEMVTCLGRLWWNPNTQTWDERMAAEPGSGQLNPLHETTYKVVQNVIDEVAELFPEGFYHAGADEVAPGCWNASQDIVDYISSGNGTMSSLLEIFINRTYPMITRHNKTVVYWEDILLDRTVQVPSRLLPRESTVIQTWNNGAANTKAVTSAGYRAVVSSSDFLYLDCGRGDFLLNDTRFDQPNSTVTPPSFNVTGESSSFNYGGTGGSWCAPYKTWQRIYDYDITYGLEESEAALVLGAEAALWSEMADGGVLDSLVWPRGAALAEMTWSGNRDETGSRKRTGEAGYRLAEWRERMVGRGVAAQSMMPRWCLRNHGLCNINI